MIQVIQKKTKSNLLGTLRSSTEHGQSTGSNSEYELPRFLKTIFRSYLKQKAYVRQ